MAELTAKQQAFVNEYLIDLNATQAAIRAGYSEKTAEIIGFENLRKPNIEKFIKEAMNKRSEKTEITQAMVLERYWKIATADPRKLIEYRRCACRYCHGNNFKYHWIDENEFAQSYTESVAHNEYNPNEQYAIPDNEGGYGFNPTSSPNEDCPKCFGRGSGEVAAHDTRNIDEQTSMLYAGVKVTKDGLEIKMHDQLKALETVARHLGMFIDQTKISGDANNPFTLLINQVGGSSFKPVQTNELDE